jgi:hypothetical protein
MVLVDEDADDTINGTSGTSAMDVVDTSKPLPPLVRIH